VRSEVFDPRVLTADDLVARTLEVLDDSGVGLVVLAGYMHLVPAALVRLFHGPMLNIHPALLPAFGGQGLYGMRVHQAVIASGARVSGVTVHLVDDRYDTGPIVAQWPVPVLIGDTPEALAARVLQVEHRLLPAVVEAFALRGQAASHPTYVQSFELGPLQAPDVAALRHLIRLPVEPPQE
jgi:phosphoribosylglycinamide formyltransferase 1